MGKRNNREYTNSIFKNYTMALYVISKLPNLTRPQQTTQHKSEDRQFGFATSCNMGVIYAMIGSVDSPKLDTLRSRDTNRN